jgi:hypothetical protein
MILTGLSPAITRRRPFHARCDRKIGPRCETKKPADQRLSEGSHRIVCHIPADELAQTGAIFTSAPS